MFLLIYEKQEFLDRHKSLWGNVRA